LPKLLTKWHCTTTWSASVIGNI